MSAPSPAIIAQEAAAVEFLRTLANTVADITHAPGVNVSLSVFRAAYVANAPAVPLPPRFEVSLGESAIIAESIAEVLTKAPRHRQDLFNRIQRTRDELQRLEAEAAGAAPGKEWP